MLYLIDFETASQLDIMAVGAWAYAMHPSTRVLMLAYQPVDRSQPVRVWFPGQEPPKALQTASGFIAHGVEFELAIWHHVLRRMEPRFVPMVIPKCHCTMSMARAAGLPGSLEDMGAALMLTQQKMSARGKQLIKFFSIINPDGSRNMPRDHLDNWIEFVEYCKADVATMGEAYGHLPKIEGFERRVFETHLRINARGIRVDLPRVRKLRQLCLQAEVLITHGPEGRFLSRPAELVAYLWVLGIEVENAKGETLEAALISPEATPYIKDLIRRRLDFAKSSNKKYKRMIQAAPTDQRIRGLHVYFGAHTGRFSGTLVQAQNIIRDCVGDIPYNLALLDSLPDDDPVKAVGYIGGPGDVLAWASWMIRPMFMATPGRYLVTADFKAIEARVLAWLVGAEGMQKQYRDGDDPYKHMAAKIFKVAVDKVDSYQRWVGKQVVLGCGYGMGWLKFMLRCALEGQDIPEDDCRLAVATYRQEVSEVPAGWRAIDDAVSYCMAHPGTAKILFNGKLSLWTNEHQGRIVNLNIKLPDGSIQSYRYPKYITLPSIDPERQDEKSFTFLTAQKQSVDPGIAAVILARCEAARKDDIVIDPKPYLKDCTIELKGFRRVSAWGGKFMENIVQKIARNLLTEAMVRVDQRFPIVLHVHDELVPEVDHPDDEHEVKRLMEIVPPWAAGAVIEVETGCHERYRK